MIYFDFNSAMFLGQVYKNDRLVGKAIKLSGVPREEITLVSKFSVDDVTTVDDILHKLDTALKNLGTTYMDAYMVSKLRVHCTGKAI